MHVKPVAEQLLGARSATRHWPARIVRDRDTASQRWQCSRREECTCSSSMLVALRCVCFRSSVSPASVSCFVCACCAVDRLHPAPVSLVVVVRRSSFLSPSSLPSQMSASTAAPIPASKAAQAMAIPSRVKNVGRHSPATSLPSRMRRARCHARVNPAKPKAAPSRMDAVCCLCSLLLLQPTTGQFMDLSSTPVRALADVPHRSLCVMRSQQGHR